MTCTHDFPQVPYASVYIAGTVVDRILVCKECGELKRETVGGSKFLDAEFAKLMAEREAKVPTKPEQEKPEPSMEAILASIRRIIFNIFPVLKDGDFGDQLCRSLQFALHRPPNGKSRRRLCSSPKDVAGGIYIGICLMPAMPTVESRLVLATCFVDSATLVAGLTGVGRIYFAQLPATFGELVGKEGFELMPSVVQNGAVQPRLLPNVPARRVNRSCRTRGHVLGLQRLQHHHAMRRSNLGGALMVPVQPGAGHFGFRACQSLAGGIAAVRSTLTPGKRLGLLARAPIQDIQPFFGYIQEPAVRQRDSVRHASVYTNRRTEVLRRLVLDLDAEDDVPAQGIAGEGDVLDRAGNVTGQPELHFSDLRQLHGSPLGVELAPLAVATAEAEAVVDATFARRGIVGPARKEVAERLIQIPKRLLLRNNGHCGNPVELSPQRSQFTSLRRVTDGTPGICFELAPPVTTLLQSEVIDEAADTSVLAEQGLLFVSGIKPVSVASVQHALFFLPVPVNDTPDQVRHRNPEPLSFPLEKGNLRFGQADHLLVHSHADYISTIKAPVNHKLKKGALSFPA